ncbi:MAG: hypothetical protein ABI758_03395 [Candidatus Woesebacteria bacterium]
MQRRSFLFALFTVIITFLVISFSFRSLIFSMGTHLPDWNDYPFYVWTVYQNVGHLKSLSFHHFFNTNIFYPYQGTLLFSDLLLPQSIIALPFSFFISNPILVFNIVFFITLLLNVTSTYFFWRQIIDKNEQVFLAVFATCVSGFLFQNSVHFQFLGFWPFFFGFGYLVKNQKTTKDLVCLGIWAGIQFLAGVYLAIFLLCAIFLWYGLEFFWNKKNKESLLSIVRQLFIVLVTFTLIAGFFAFKYIEIKKMYQINREFWEYIYYSAHLTDYVFSTNYQSIISNLWPISKWNSFNHAGSLFPGFLISGLFLIGLFSIKKIKTIVSISIMLKREDIFFFLLLIGGFFASLGPRLNVNGTYAIVPLPYLIPLKLIPLLDPIRVNSRWYLYVLIALIYFALKGMRKFNFLSKTFIVALFCFVVALEVMPITKSTEAKAYYHDVYSQIEPICTKNTQVLLEYPMTQNTKDINVVTNLTYRTQAMLASLRHHCTLVNGYMGYVPKDYVRYESELTTSVNSTQSAQFWKLIDEKQVRFIKLNKHDLFSEKVLIVEKFFQGNPKVKILADTDAFVIAEVSQ